MELQTAAARLAGAGLCGSGPPVKSMPQGALSCRHYHGTYEPCGKPARNGAQATYEGTLAATLLDRELVLPILPPGARLAKPKTSAWTLHPVLWLMGRQNDPRWLRNKSLQIIPGAKPYTELILLVPYTVDRDEGLWHNYAVRLYLDDIGATLIGELAYAYAKLLGEFDLTETSATVRCAGNTVFEIESDVEPDDADEDDAGGATGDWLSDAEARTKWPGYSDACAILDMPIVGYSALLGYRRSYFEWHYGAAKIASTHCVFRVNQELRPGMRPWVDLGYLPNAPQAAFKVRQVRWRLSTTFPHQNFRG